MGRPANCCSLRRVLAGTISTADVRPTGAASKRPLPQHPTRFLEQSILQDRHTIMNKEKYSMGGGWTIILRKKYRPGQGHVLSLCHHGRVGLGLIFQWHSYERRHAGDDAMGWVVLRLATPTGINAQPVPPPGPARRTSSSRTDDTMTI
jgi:hypothetical protein